MFSMNEFDNNILQFIQNHMRSSVMDEAMIVVTSLGNLGIIWIVISAFILIRKKNKTAVIGVLCAMLLGTILGQEILKNIIQRPRPFLESSVINMIIEKPVSYSFPSGHTTAAFAAAGILSKYFKKYSVLFFTIAILIGFSRLYLYVHYPTDVIAGAILGLVCSRIVYNGLNRNKVIKKS